MLSQDLHNNLRNAERYIDGKAGQQSVLDRNPPLDSER